MNHQKSFTDYVINDLCEITKSHNIRGDILRCKVNNKKLHIENARDTAAENGCTVEHFLCELLGMFGITKEVYEKVKEIRTPNQAILNIRDDNEWVRWHCEQILKDGKGM